jgi:capsular exopolysaccharide synthesis family protein
LLAAARDGSAEQRRIVLVSSAVSGEGKTSIATNLAVAAARVGLRVVLVDADLRNPQVAERFGLGGAPGLSDALATGVPVSQHLMDVGVEGLRVLAGGTIPPNPAELLASPATRSILNELAASSDVVVVDTAPILAVADTLELVTPHSLVLMVARKGISRMHSLSASLLRIRQVGGHVAGSVFNDVEARTTHTYGYVEPIPPSRQNRKKDAQGGDDAGIGLIA